MTAIAASLQSRLGRAVRSRVAGEEAASRAARIWDTPGERWFTPADPVWRVHADAAMFPGGIAALLLQSLHPLAMAGVAGHSGYRGDPWGRLQRTSNYLATTTFGTVADAEQTIAVVRSVHARVRGRDEQGRAYRADDPALLSWVHLAEVDCFLTAYQAYARDPLSPSEADRYVAQTGTAARLLGAGDPPTSTAALAQQLHTYRPELEVTAAARDAARFLLREPPLPSVARPGSATLAAGGVAVLPPWARRMLDLRTGPAATTGLARSLGRAGTATVRWAMAGVDR